jgi:hypothetical protein
MRKPEYTNEEIIKALNSAAGIVSGAARMLKCTPMCVRNYINRNPEIKQAQVDIREDMLDLAESKLLLGIKKGNVTFTIFFLKTQGKERGYIEGHHLSGPKGGPIPIMTSSFDPSKLDTETLLKLRAAMVEPDAVADAE